ncbi:MAG: hypothetical protein A2Z91_02420 [Deltaproteobacteria bacterium GWA2_38_16]|nr:MAG: hypothetical protein A2Z91_02420 [Deltaproteobacteria bacterium GWA2_38_16]OGQ02049.1 MAG: hypothetical protein A3D19_08715 [Deltaproteobacteria bacterium RIFCSPHIGHO2_02_FULL_38_15]OGQ33531.1 MAG: hypothetical protein A3A72_08655 [Deltaproteobacteria bacterium RIFCSPLOWO2_01_FULL_38_9]HBQ21585.1 citrate synthase [Deltaproteobacteria bacterium]
MAAYNKGLEDVIAGESKLGFIDGSKGLLAYCGYPVEVLAKDSSFLETSYLLLNSILPNKNQLQEFDKALREKRELPKNILDIISKFPPNTHPMVSLQAIVALLGAFTDDPAAEKKTPLLYERSLELIARFPTIVAACQRVKNKKDIIAPNPKLDHSSNFLYMTTGKVPDPEEAHMFDVCLILHAEHSFNASTFAARVVASTLTSLHSSIAAAIGSLYGPLHGGANEKVLEMISQIKSPDTVEKWVLDKFAKKEKIMGMGHRIYSVKDPRSYILEDMLGRLSKKKNNTKSYEVLKKIEEVTCREMQKLGKNIWPNVDFFSGALYTLMEIPSEIFTPVFAIARISGWCAHVIEQLKDNKLFRPECEYTGARNLTYASIETR